MSSEIRVLLEAYATDDELAAVVAAFEEVGLNAHVQVDPLCKGAGGEFPWMVAVSVPLAPFIASFASEAGKDAYAKVKKLIKRLYDSRKESQFRAGRVIIIDSTSGKSAILPPGLSPDEWRRLADLNLPEYSSSVFRWDPSTGEWQEIRYR